MLPDNLLRDRTCSSYKGKPASDVSTFTEGAKYVLTTGWGRGMLRKIFLGVQRGGTREDPSPTALVVSPLNALRENVLLRSRRMGEGVGNF